MLLKIILNSVTIERQRKYLSGKNFKQHRKRLLPIEKFLKGIVILLASFINTIKIRRKI